MKNFIFIKKLKLFLTVTLGIFLVSIPLSSAMADDDPIWEYPAMPILDNNGLAFACMADAYLVAGGKGLKNVPGVAELNCTANDVEITHVEALGIKVNGIWVLKKDLPPGESLTCHEGDLFTLRANVTVKTNADTRYDTTFYLPLNDLSPQVVQGDTVSSCSMIIPNPDADNMGLSDGSVELDGDLCGDIDKTDLVDDDYVLEEAEFTMLCATEPDAIQVVFNYCAAWSVKDEADCKVNDTIPNQPSSPIFGQVPSQTSKCNCGDLLIDVFTSPLVPSLTKKLVPDTITDSATEFDTDGNRTFKYLYTIDKVNDSDIIHVTSLHDVIYTDHDPNADPLPDGTVNVSINLFSAANDDGKPFGTHIEIFNNTCNNDVVNGEIIIAAGIPGYSCTIEIRLTDDNLPDSEQLGSLEDPIVRNFPPIPEEVYFDYAYATFEDKFGTTIDDMKVSCNLLSLEAALVPPDDAVCSNEKFVSITDIKPQVTILKEVDEVLSPNSLGLRKKGNIWYINKNGEITFKVTVTNPPVTGENNQDAVWANEYDIFGLSGFRDDWSVEDEDGIPKPTENGTINLYNESHASNNVDCSGIAKNSGSALDVGVGAPSQFGPCDYKVTLNLEEGDTYINTAKVEVRDNENRLAYADSMVKVTLAQPMIRLEKHVATVTIENGNVTNTGTFNDIGISIDEPGDYVIWRIDIFNDNEATQEPLEVTGIDDSIKFNDGTPSGHDVTTSTDNITPTKVCSFPQILTYDGDDIADYSCTFVTKVTGNYLDVITNRATANAYLWTTDNGGSRIGELFMSNWDEATVTLLDVPANASLNVKLATTVFVTITNPSTHENLYISEFNLHGNYLAEILGPSSPIILTNDGGTFNGDTGFGPCPMENDFPTAPVPANVDLSDYYITIGFEDDDRTFKCAFTAEILTNNNSENGFSIENTSLGEGLSIIVIDGEGGEPSAESYSATVQLLKNLQ